MEHAHLSVSLNKSNMADHQQLAHPVSQLTLPSLASRWNATTANTGREKSACERAGSLPCPKPAAKQPDFPAAVNHIRSFVGQPPWEHACEQLLMQGATPVVMDSPYATDFAERCLEATTCTT
jgi:hypothetical protein